MTGTAQALRAFVGTNKRLSGKISYGAYMQLLFWLCFALVAYAYFGYAVFLQMQVRLRQRPFARDLSLRSVSIIIAARNEEANLPLKLENLRAMNYPRDLVQIVIASDGSTDRTAEILRANSSSILPVVLDESHGKASALNDAVRSATGEILVFMDVRQSVDVSAVSALVSSFADPSVGAVSGQLLLLEAASDEQKDALGIYWKIEKLVRKLESKSGSVVGVTGAIYAIRRELYTEMPRGTILDDVFIPMHVVRMGKRVVFQPDAIARDRIFSEKGREFSRKVRTLTGNYQLVRLEPWLLTPSNPLLFRFISHKVLRLAVPFLLVLILLATILSSGIFFRLVLCLQAIFYILAALGMMLPSVKKFKLIAIPTTFVMLNAAAALAFYNFAVGRERVWL